MMEGRDPNQKLAVTWTPIGTDVNFGEITRQFVGHLQTQKLRPEAVQRSAGHHPQRRRLLARRVQEPEGRHRVGNRRQVRVHRCAGGGALHLLQKSGIPEAKEYAGFPVGGSFLVTDNPAVAMQHMAKAYGIARPARHRCRVRTWTPACWMASASSCLARSRPLDQVPEEGSYLTC
jgi:malate dehydrogenase (quinone)